MRTDEYGEAVWAEVQGVLAAAHRDGDAAVATLERMLAGFDPATGPDVSLARALVLRGISRLELLIRGRPAAAVPPAQEATRLLTALPDTPALHERRVGAFGDLANALMSADRHEEALAAARTGLEHAQRCADRMNLVRALVRIGGMLASMRRPAESQECHALALAVARAADDPEAVGLAQLGLGLRARERGAVDEAVDHLWAALRGFAASGNLADQQTVLQCLAEPDIAGARPDVARALAREIAALQARVRR